MNPYETVDNFEKTVAKYAGSKHAVALDSCTNALFLCCKYLEVKKVIVPCRTYVSVPCAVINSGGSVKFKEINWQNDRFYKLDPYPIYDAAHLFHKNMYIKNSYFCISFSSTKTINIGKGGMILTNDSDSVNWFKRARYCGRNQIDLLKDKFEMIGWNMYMTTEQAARGLLLFNNFKNNLNNNSYKMPEYPNLSKFKVYKKKI